MPVSIADLISKSTKSVPVILSDDLTLTVNYFISYMTPEFEAKFAKLGTDVSQADLIAEFVDSWSVATGEGVQTEKCTKASLEKVGTIVQNAIWKAVWEDCFPNAKTASN